MFQSSCLFKKSMPKQARYKLLVDSMTQTNDIQEKHISTQAKNLQLFTADFFSSNLSLNLTISEITGFQYVKLPLPRT